MKDDDPKARSSQYGATREPKRYQWMGSQPEPVWSEIDFDRIETTTLEEMEARARRPRARLRRLVMAPRWAAERWLERARVWFQRGSRGYTDNEVWMIDVFLCQRLGSMLALHADGARNYPADKTYDEWIGELRSAADGLLAFDPDDADCVRGAQDALHWVADNLTRLWD